MGLLQVQIVKYLQIKNKKNNRKAINFLIVFFKYLMQILHVKHTILRCSVQGKHIQVLNLTIFEMTYLGQENDFVKS